MSDLYCLTDEQMVRLRPYFPKSCGSAPIYILDQLDAERTLIGTEIRLPARLPKCRRLSAISKCASISPGINVPGCRHAYQAARRGSAQFHGPTR